MSNKKKHKCKQQTFKLFVWFWQVCDACGHTRSIKACRSVQYGECVFELFSVFVIFSESECAIRDADARYGVNGAKQGPAIDMKMYADITSYRWTTRNTQSA